MDRWRGRVALVTGASVGIGAAIAKELVRSGMTVVGCARDVDKVQVGAQMTHSCQIKVTQIKTQAAIKMLVYFVTFFKQTLATNFFQTNASGFLYSMHLLRML